jgi:hypothetical protein
LGNDVFKRNKARYCSGTSSECIGAIAWNDWRVYDSCTLSEFCDASKAGTTAFSCSSTQCTSGDCCDTTCGKYTFKSSSIKCLDGTENGCPWGTNLGNDFGERPVSQFCSGSSGECNGARTNGNWQVSADCSATQYCDSSSGCIGVTCSTNSDCTADSWQDVRCYNSDVYGDFLDYSCANGGSKNAYCDFTRRDDLKKEECGDSGYTGVNYCYDEDVYRDYSVKGCLNRECYSNNERRKQADCASGCTNGMCNGESCTDECTLDEKRCSDNYAQICGNYDGDSCLEWPSAEGEGNKNCGLAGCEEGKCKKPDLSIESLKIQATKEKNVTLAFTIKNIGNVTANNIYWAAYLGEEDRSLKRTKPIELQPGGWTRAFMILSYSISGSYNARVVVDNDNLIEETDEENNEALIPITV